ncbi:DUF3732 domain-containing protein [Demequina sp. NBRC 110052]|uniref:DUF3732 domain-containing protein n=1 Tax=Demequina sp. NBRC 110052 TaxID=1570341 RepID=UPI000A04C9CA|nr:DUF3732 domain-containing protein [Demequina sp. NBRC 110052]
MQIISVSIYSHEGEERSVKFTPGALNIVTGDSKTGKSALISIVDYCLGRKKSSIPQTEPFKKISWYALLVQFQDGSRAIAAREAPVAGHTSSRAMLEFGGPALEPPLHADLHLNSDTASLRAHLGARMGLADVRLESGEESTRPSVAITLGHAVPLTLQEQHEIDSKSILFHRQNERGIQAGLRDSLPFFLGAVDGQQAAKRSQLREARSQLRRIEVSIGAAEEERKGWEQELRELLAEARSVQLVEGLTDDSDPLTVLNRIRFDRSRKVVAEDADISLHDERRAKEGHRSELSNELRSLITHRDLLLDERDGEDGYDSSLDAQAGRLAVIGLMPADHGDSNACPICAQPLERADPTVAQMSERLTRLKAELHEVSSRRTRTQKAVGNIDAKIKEIRRELNIIDAWLTTNATVDRSESLEASQEFVRGRVDAILSRLKAFNDEGLAELARQRSSAAATVKALEGELNAGSVREQLLSRLNALSVMLERYARDLNLEQADDPIRLDVEDLTIVVDTSSGPLPLENIGSGENWVGYHVATHLALHEFFIDQQRPVPRFLMIDQPSKAHFQSDSPHDKADPDRETVRNMFKQFARYAGDKGDAFQLIVIDHANYKDPWFQDAVAHNWREGEVLIPESWPQPKKATATVDADDK